ncbi:hypothetical protein GFPCMMHI_01141 [Ensifer adhaerens]|nr:hypothetical protein [Ensifer adhaerens]
MFDLESCARSAQTGNLQEWVLDYLSSGYWANLGFRRIGRFVDHIVTDGCVSVPATFLDKRLLDQFRIGRARAVTAVFKFKFCSPAMEHRKADGDCPNEKSLSLTNPARLSGFGLCVFHEAGHPVRQRHLIQSRFSHVCINSRSRLTTEEEPHEENFDCSGSACACRRKF